MRFVVTVEREAAKRWSGAAPSIPGCALRAESKEGALHEIKKSIKARIEMMAARRLSIPEDEPVAPILLVVVKVNELFKWDAVEVGKESGLLGLRLWGRPLACRLKGPLAPCAACKT
jgi:predicted RNase H-like HicB family nuclease